MAFILAMSPKGKYITIDEKNSMKLSLFVHMERLSPETPQDQLYQEMVELCQMADDAGMHTIWTGEHHGMNFTITPNPFLNIVDLAHRTKQVRLGTGTIVAPFWHPIKLAGEAAMCDLITQGRLEIGIARGAYAFEYERLKPGLDAFSAGQCMREMIPAIKQLWEGDYAHEGQTWQFPKTTSSPKPLQQPHPPLWVAARDPNSHEFAIEQGCNVQVTPLWNGDEEVQLLMRHFVQAVEKFPAIPRPKIMLLRHTYVSEDDKDTQVAAQEINRFYNYFGAWFLNKRPVSQGLIQPLSQEEMDQHPMYSPELMLKNQVIGDSETVIKRLKACQDLGYDEYAYWVDSSMSFARKRASLKRFIEQVMPAFTE